MPQTIPLGRQAQERSRETKILRAALEELARSDYGGMSIERVAARAGVNKTTIYRKWQTKAALIRAALASVFETYRVGPTAGDLRADLLRIAHIILAFTRSFEGQCLTRLRLLQHPEPELADIAQALNAKQLAELGALMSAAVARGELAPDVDIVLIVDMMWGAVHARVMKDERVDDALLSRIVDLLVRAATPLATASVAQTSRRSRSAPSRPRGRRATSRSQASRRSRHPGSC